MGFTINDLCEVMAAEGRRCVIDCLPDEPVSVETLTERADCAAEGSVNTMALHHCHLPKLDRHDVVEWDEQTVARGTNYEKVRWLLASARTLDLDAPDADDEDPVVFD